MKQPKTTSRLVKAAERRAFVLNLRKKGMTYRKIAEEVHAAFPSDDIPKGYDCRLAWQDVMRELRKLNEERHEGAEEIRRLQAVRLDALLFAFWDRAVEGDEKAFDRVDKMMRRRAALFGVDSAKVMHNLNLDLDRLTDEQLERIADGENPASVLAAATPSSGDARTEAAEEAKS